MKKNDLIKLLCGIEGNPTIMLYNSLVDDVADVSNHVTELELVKESIDHIVSTLVHERMKERGTFDALPDEEMESIKAEARRIRSEMSYELPNRFVCDEDFERWYGKRTKKVLVFQPKVVGHHDVAHNRM